MAFDLQRSRVSVKRNKTPEFISLATRFLGRRFLGRRFPGFRFPGHRFLGRRFYNHGQKSWDKLTFVALFHTRQTNSSTLVQPPVHTLFLQSFNIVLGGGGRKQRILKRITVLF